MRSFLILGGFLGFVMALALGWAQQNDWPSLLWRAALTAYAAGLLMRWWGGVWLKSLQAARYEQHALAVQASAASNLNDSKP